MWIGEVPLRIEAAVDAKKDSHELLITALGVEEDLAGRVGKTSRTNAEISVSCDSSMDRAWQGRNG